ncbi:MAG: hypothetical protein CVT89_02495 [Candidatus Altiarchaeales archaeon HGW-Altiarchaeales-2]|nr:MAG: hypothetical protein CVT89_02495 [Candidatus Altiarchaeales archaeon HGW-Altiarchaeales-2]
MFLKNLNKMKMKKEEKEKKREISLTLEEVWKIIDDNKEEIEEEIRKEEENEIETAQYCRTYVIR